RAAKKDAVGLGESLRELLGRLRDLDANARVCSLEATHGLVAVDRANRWWKVSDDQQVLRRHLLLRGRRSGIRGGSSKCRSPRPGAQPGGSGGSSSGRKGGSRL